MIYLEVAVAAPINQPLTYKLPDHIDPSGIAPGQRLLVPLGNRLVTGYLLALTEQAPPGRIRAIADLLDPAPLFPASMVPFFRWLAGYYQYPIGEAIKGALPGGLTTESGRALRLTDSGRPKLAAVAGAPLPWLAALLEKGRLPPGATRKLWRANEQLLRQWQEKGWIEIETVLRTDATTTKSELCARLAPPRAPLPKLKPSEEKTLALLGALAAATGGEWVARKELARDYPSARSALRGLAEKGLVELAEQEVYRDPFGEPAPFFPRPEQLTAEQEAALTQILPAVAGRKFAPFLLHGVTGSGKTEVYLRAAEATLVLGRSVMVLVPEIALATQLEGHFVSRFGHRVALIHSGLSAGERYDQWQRLLRGQAQIAIGARSAIFAPFSDPGLIIVDEEHDPAYKQEEGLRYQARDLAVLRASQQQAVVLLGSATPSVTSYFHAAAGKYHLLTLTKRIEDRPMPQVEVVDLRTIPTISGRPPLFSNQLIRAIRQTLAGGDQSLIFLNRRGFASTMLCQDCGHTVQCRHCQVTLTLHKGRGQLICHYCGFATTSAILCSNCQSPKVIGVGFGTERLEEELTTRFPKARIGRLDRDTTLKRTEFLATLRAVHQREIDILIGTQMITKGHHFPHVTLVGIVWADAGLGMPDFKAGERTFQLLSQVTGRAGRGDKPGKVIVQTHQPDHYSVLTAQAHDYPTLYQQELDLRRQLQYPPFSRLINLRLEGTDEAQVRKVAIDLARRATHLARQRPGLSVLGPVQAPLARLRGRYRWQLLLKGTEIDALHALCGWLMEKPAATGAGGSVKLTVDVDPENML
ncbi:MAG: primosomal protein N' [Desulfobulbaceae bacterium]|nr:primosomal protein N' [Desulfobulbaceae bacterium]